jgi:hypothetical protein
MFNSLAQYPHWFVVTCAVVGGAIVLWIVVKLLKAALWMLLFGAIVVAVSAAAWLLLR